MASSRHRCAFCAVISAQSNGRRHLDNVHCHDVGAQHDLADGVQQVDRLHAARFRRPGARCEPGIEDVDVDRQIDMRRTVEGLRDRILDDGCHAPVAQFPHEMPAHPLLAHPREDVGRRPVAPQADLHEVLSRNGSQLDEPSHRRPMRVQIAPETVAGIRVSVEVHDPETPRGVRCGDGRCRGPRDRVVAADDHRDDVSLRDLANSGPYRGVRDLGHARHAERVPVVDDPQHVEWRNLELEVPFGGLIRRGTDAARSEPGAGAVGDAVIPGRADDGNIRSHVVELLGARQQGHPGEGRRTEVCGPVCISVHAGQDYPFRASRADGRGRAAYRCPVRCTRLPATV